MGKEKGSHHENGHYDDHQHHGVSSLWEEKEEETLYSERLQVANGMGRSLPQTDRKSAREGISLLSRAVKELSDLHPQLELISILKRGLSGKRFNPKWKLF